jgi:hypothetical protein
LPSIIISIVNMYFCASFLSRELVRCLSPDSPYLRSLLNGDMIDAAIILTFLAVLVISSAQLFIATKRHKRSGHLSNKASYARADINSRSLIVIGLVAFVLSQSVLKYMSAGMSYENLHLMLSTSVLGKIQYFSYFAIAIETYIILRYPNDKFVRNTLLFQLLFSIFFVELRSFIALQLFVLLYNRDFFDLLKANPIKSALAVTAFFSLPIVFRSGGDLQVSNLWFYVSFFVYGGAFQIDLYILFLNETLVIVSTAYTSSGGGYGNFLPLYLYHLLGDLSLVVWALLPTIVQILPHSVRVLVGIYYATIVRNDPASWQNGLLFMVLIIALLKLLSVATSKKGSRRGWVSR